MREKILYFSLLHNGNWEKINNSLLNNEKINNDEFIKLKQKNNYKYTTIIDEDYPDPFKKLINPPFVIYYKGNYKLANDKLYSMYFNTSSPLNVIDDIKSYINKRFKDSKKIFMLEKISIKELVRINKKILVDNVVFVVSNSIDDTLIKYENINNTIKEDNNLIISETPFFKEIDNENDFSFRMIAAISNELFMPWVKKDIESYKILCHCIDYDTKISTIKTDENNKIANNFLITQGAKNIKRKTN